MVNGVGLWKSERLLNKEGGNKDARAKEVALDGRTAHSVRWACRRTLVLPRHLRRREKDSTTT